MELWDYIKEKMMENPSQKVCEENAETTYEELVIFSQTFAEKVKGEKSCAIICRSELAAAMAILGCFAAEVTAVPMSMKYGKQHCEKILDTISPTAIISDVYSELKVIGLRDASYIQSEASPALIMCTSGTTGVPKGAMLSEQNILTNLKDIAKYLKIDSEDSVLISRPLYHSGSLTGEFLISLIKGARIHFCSEKFNCRNLLDIIDEKGISVFGGSPTMLDMLVRVKRKDEGKSIRKICISGEKMSLETGRKIADAFSSADIYVGYGLTEASPRVSYLHPEKFYNHCDTVGEALDSIELKIINEYGKEAVQGEEGTLWVKGGNIMMGYYNNPKLTASVLKDNWLCTGDIAFITEEGLLKIKGRKDGLIIRAGMNIYPQEIEEEIKKDKRVREVIVYGEKDRYGIMQIKMNISGSFSGVDEVKKMCIEKLPGYQVPMIIELMDELPKNASGKIIRGGVKGG